MQYIKKIVLVIATILIIIFGKNLLFKEMNNNLQIQFPSLMEGVVSDELVIPDKFNTGVINHNALIKVTDLNSIKSDVEFKTSAGEIVLNWKHTATLQGKDYIVENYDFSDFGLRFYSSEFVTKKTTITFKNCNFSYIKFSEVKNYNIMYIFENCTFNDTVAGSNITFNKCRFIATTGDCTDAFANVNYNDCLLTVIPKTSPYESHLDGIQLYGRSGVKVEDVHMKNCRIIAPSIEPVGSIARVNASIMLKLDYNDADNVTFDNMHVTGGGYTMYSQPNGFQMTNIAFRNIKVGCTHRYGMLYRLKNTDGWNNAIHENVGYVNNLYVGSIWHDGNSIHISVTNDTNVERTLKVVLATGTVKEYVIKRCPLFKEFTENMSYESLPFDQEIIIPNVKTNYVKCYEENTLLRTQVFGNIDSKVEITSITIKNMPNIIEYEIGTEKLDLTGSLLEITYSDGTKKNIDINDEMISGFDGKVIGENKIKVTYLDRTTDFIVKIVPKEIKKIEFKQLPFKLQYKKETKKIDLIGGIITVTYIDETKEDILMNDEMISDFDISELGIHQITLEYRGKRMFFPIEIIDNTTIEKIVIKTLKVIEANKDYIYVSLIILGLGLALIIIRKIIHFIKRKK